MSRGTTFPRENVSRPAAVGPLVEQLHSLVRRGGRRWRRLALLRAAGLFVAAVLAYLWLAFFLDNWLHLPVWGRTLAALGFVAVLALSVDRLRRLRRSLVLTPDAVALAMERRTPGGLQNRLINTLQIAREHGTGRLDLGDAVMRENYRHLQLAKPRQAAQARPAFLCAGLGVLIMAVGVVFWLSQPDWFTNAATRILLPFADVDPIYRTTLTVEPGDVVASGDVPVTVRIHGERPDTLAFVRDVAGRRTVETVPVAAEADTVRYTFLRVRESMTYSVRGGDFASPYYRIDVPAPAAVRSLRIDFQFPAYTRLPEKTVEKTAGDLEALRGTRAHLTFVFDRPVDGAALLVERPGPEPQRQDLERLGPAEYRGQLLFEDAVGYRVETRQGERPPDLSPAYAVRVLADQEPRLELTGLQPQTEADADSVFPLRVAAADDYGLDKVGLFLRRVGQAASSDDGWEPIVVWEEGGKTESRRETKLAIAGLNVATGERIEVALRALDTDPLRKGRWTDGSVYTLHVGGENNSLQIQYEQIVRTEAELHGLLRDQQGLTDRLDDWVSKLDGKGGLRWDDPKNLDALHAAVRDQVRAQELVRQSAGKSARAMLPQAGNLRVALGMLADTEMVRALRVLEGVAERDGPQAKRAALGEARVTQQRTARSLREILEQFAAFRADWELANMVPFTRMLAERQTRLAEQSSRHAGEPTEIAGKQRAPAARRQAKILDLCGLIQPAFVALGERLKSSDATLAAAFTAGAATLTSEELKRPLTQAADSAKVGRWAEAAKNQETAARELNALHTRLRQAQTDAARKALAALREDAKTDAEAKQLLDALQAGNAEQVLLDLPSRLKMEEIVHMREVTAKKNAAIGPDRLADPLQLTEAVKKRLQATEPGKGQDFKALKLAETPQKGSTRFPQMPEGEANKVRPFINEKFEDLVGKLLDEADELGKEYAKLTLNMAGKHSDPGEVGKLGGRLNSTSADSVTGNMKPDVNQSAGVSRAGRQGARAAGMVVGDESVNRRGRDTPLEGQSRVADQHGTLREKKSDDMQRDTATGVGGKKVEGGDPKFSLSNVGRWTTDMAKRLGPAKEKNYIVERQDGKLDPRVAALLRDLETKQEQLIERIKAVRHELRNLYLPTDHLEEMEQKMAIDLGSLKERPDAELFRIQSATLEKLQSAVRVFRGANAGFQPSLPRARAVRGDIVDEPARPTVPGYEDAVRRYYDRLVNR
jgi:hypothetical protein